MGQPPSDSFFPRITRYLRSSRPQGSQDSIQDHQIYEKPILEKQDSQTAVGTQHEKSSGGNAKDWFARIVSFLSLITSAATLYLTYIYSNVEVQIVSSVDLNSMWTDLRTDRKDKGVSKFSYETKIGITFINSGNKPVVIQSIKRSIYLKQTNREVPGGPSPTIEENCPGKSNDTSFFRFGASTFEASLLPPFTLKAGEVETKSLTIKESNNISSDSFTRGKKEANYAVDYCVILNIELLYPKPNKEIINLPLYAGAFRVDDGNYSGEMYGSKNLDRLEQIISRRTFY